MSNTVKLRLPLLKLSTLNPTVGATSKLWFRWGCVGGDARGRGGGQRPRSRGGPAQSERGGRGPHLELVDDGGLPAVVQPHHQHVHLRAAAGRPRSAPRSGARGEGWVGGGRRGRLGRRPGPAGRRPWFSGRPGSRGAGPAAPSAAPRPGPQAPRDRALTRSFSAREDRERNLPTGPNQRGWLVGPKAPGPKNENHPSAAAAEAATSPLSPPPEHPSSSSAAGCQGPRKKPPKRTFTPRVLGQDQQQQQTEAATTSPLRSPPPSTERPSQAAALPGPGPKKPKDL